MKKAKTLATLAMGALALVAPCGLASAAELTDTYSKDVIVGEVDETIYSVDISWGDMVFDWKYNEGLGRFIFSPQFGCYGVALAGYRRDEQAYSDAAAYLAAAANLGHLYTDEECSAVTHDGNVDDDTIYYIKYFPKNNISVVDLSYNGHLEATASFETAEGYDWVDGKFADDYAISNEYEIVTYYETIDGVRTIMNPEDQIASEHHISLAQGAMATILSKKLFLRPKAGTIANSSSVTAGDKLGTITVTISPKTM